MPWLLDTNTVSLLARGRDADLLAKVDSVREDCVISAITWFELEYGAARRPDLIAVHRRLDFILVAFPEVQFFGEDAAFHAAAVRTSLEKRKPNALPIGPYDVLIAGHALSLGAVLVTGDRDFLRVPGLRIENWRSPRR